MIELSNDNQLFHFFVNTVSLPSKQKQIDQSYLLFLNANLFHISRFQSNVI